MDFQRNELGGWIVPDGTTLPPGTVVPSYSYIGNDGTIGNRCIIGYGCTWLGVQVYKWLTLANVDGSGRQLKVVVAVDGSVKVEAGCFVGTADEFCKKAAAEGKGTYVAVVRAVVQALTSKE